MIVDIATLLQSFATAEARELTKQGITHPPTIGAMYEGLTAKILGYAIPPGIELRVEQGFITDRDDLKPTTGQIDCMLVRGQGHVVPYTSNHIWHVKDVIAVLEVKKNLFSKDMEDAYNHLRKVGNSYSNYLATTSGDEAMYIDPSRRVFAEITGQVAPSHDKLMELPISLQQIYHNIVVEQFSPICITLGYGGLKSEYTLRKKFLEFLERQILKEGYGVPSLPNLIVAGEASLVKLSGHPYHVPLQNGEWPIMASTTENPLRLMLELIWTRLSYMHPMLELFGEDLEIDVMSPLLWATAVPVPNVPHKLGWQYGFTELTKKELGTRRETVVWEPATIDSTQFTIFTILCEGGEVDITEPDFIAYIQRDGYTVDEFIAAILKTHLVALDKPLLKLITHECTCAILPDGRFVVADNNSGRLTRWIAKFHVN